jgi:hypothetical protein
MKHEKRRLDKRKKALEAKVRVVDNRIKTLMDEVRLKVMTGPKDLFAKTVQGTKDIEAELKILEAETPPDQAKIDAKKHDLDTMKTAVRLMTEVLMEQLKK